LRSGLTILDRGYTGHEHLQSVGLIHMNGRLYDPKLHRFLQPDNFVQDASNTQNFNRYGYVLNNPLKYTDPSGEFSINWNDVIAGVAIVAGAVLCYVPGGAAIGVPLIGAGVAHFGAAYVEYSKTGDWNAASNNAGFYFGTTVDPGWGDSDSNKKDVKGVAQNGAVVKVKTVNDDKGNGNQLDPSTIGQNLPLFGGRSTYAGGDNPMTNNKDYTYSYVPTMITDYPAIGHDRRYDNLKITGASGLFFDTRAIGADWKFVSEEFQLCHIAPDIETKIDALILGTGLGMAATSKTLFQMNKLGGLGEIVYWYYISNTGVTNKPGN
jgi:RHS repeat-associated protein